MASEFEKYNQKVARKKRLPESTAKLDTEVKPLDRPQSPPRKRH